VCAIDCRGMPTATLTLCYADVRRQLDLSVQIQKTASQRTQLQLMCYQWLYEDILTSAGHQQPNTGPRASLMTDLKKVLFASHTPVDTSAYESSIVYSAVFSMLTILLTLFGHEVASEQLVMIPILLLSVMVPSLLRYRYLFQLREAGKTRDSNTGFS